MHHVTSLISRSPNIYRFTLIIFTALVVSCGGLIGISINRITIAMATEQPSNEPQKLDNETEFSFIRSVYRALGSFRFTKSDTKRGSTSKTQRNRRRNQWPFDKQDSLIEGNTAIELGVRDDQEATVRTDAPTETDVESQATVIIDKRCDFLVAPNGTFLSFWLMLVTCAVCYNMWVPVARFAFYGIKHRGAYPWLCTDLLFDAIFLMDIFVQLRTGYIEHGFNVKDGKRLAGRYLKSRHFVFDLLATIPYDLILLAATQYMCSLTRLSRLFKVYRARQFSFKMESATEHPNAWRIFKLVHTLLFTVHLATAIRLIVYPVMLPPDTPSPDFSTATPSQPWSLLQALMGEDTTSQRYIDALYWATLTLTTIGDVMEPTTEIQYILQIIGYVIGIFVFATIVGQVGSVIDQRNAERMVFARQLDHAKKYMREHDVPKEIRKSILGWYQYHWTSGKSLRKDYTDSFEMLPTKLRTELAVHVNLKALKKISFFTACEPQFLHDLVLRMQLVVIPPGQLVCRKGGVAKEMYIVSEGLLEVTSDDDSFITLLQAGDYFGEVELLMTEGSRRRISDVRSLGYSDLFVVTKEDITNLLEDYPNVKVALQERIRIYSSVHEREMQMQGVSQGAQTSSSGSQCLHTSSDKYKEIMRTSLLFCNSTIHKDRNQSQMAPWAQTSQQRSDQYAMERGKYGGCRDTTKEVAEDLMESMAVLAENLRKMTEEYNRLNARSRALEKELDRKTQELEKKNSLTSSGIHQTIYEEGGSDTGV